MEPKNEDAAPCEGAAPTNIAEPTNSSTTSGSRTVRVNRCDGGFDRYDFEVRRCIVCRKRFKAWFDFCPVNGREWLSSCIACCPPCQENGDCPRCGADVDGEECN